MLGSLLMGAANVRSCSVERQWHSSATIGRSREAASGKAIDAFLEYRIAARRPWQDISASTRSHMDTRPLAQSLVLLALAVPWCMSSAHGADEAGECKTWPTSESELVDVLGRTAVEAARLATLPAEASQARLAELVAPKATFSLGAGDVERPLGKGAAALRAMMAELQADRYRFDGWDFMSGEVDPCSPREMSVEFSSRKLSQRASIKFRFVSGKIVGGDGWLMSITSGAFPDDEKTR